MDNENKIVEETAENLENGEELQPKKVQEKKGKSTKKKLPGWKIALIVIGSIIGAIAIAVGLFFLIGTLTSKDFKTLEANYTNTRPSYTNTFTTEEKAAITAALKSNATDEEIKQAIALVYARANYNKINGDQVLTYSRGSGSAAVGINFLGSTITPSGSMEVRSFKAQSGDSFYYQKAAMVAACSVDAAKGVVANVLNQQERNYHLDGTDIYKNVNAKGSDAKIGNEDESPYIPFFTMGKAKSSYTKTYNSEEYKENVFVLDDPNEIMNYRIVENTIVLKALEDGYAHFVYNEDAGYYEMRFSLLISGENRADCVGVAREYLRKSSGSDNLEFNKYDIIMQVWDNGYIKMYHDDEIWAGDMDLLGSKSTTSSDTYYECAYYYELDENIFSEEDMAKYSDASYEGKWCQAIIEDYARKMGW